MPIECLITFDNNSQGVYYAGQELSGVVDFSVDTTKRVKAIHITVNGFTRIRWIKRGYPHDSERSTCRAFRSYLSSRSYVLGSCGSNTTVEWIAGEHSYTFHIILPENLPTSFDGKYGQIHYEIITTIDRPNRSPKIFKLPFTVIQPLDLNANALYRVPLEILQRKRFWSFCCPTGPLTVKLSTPYCGYAPGQKINFVLYIDNQSSIDVTSCHVQLKQEVIYESHNPQHEFRYDKHLIAQQQFGNVLRWSRKIYRGYLELPSIPPTTIKSICPITVTYVIKIIVKPTDFHWKLKLKVPLTIGSTPIVASNSRTLPLPVIGDNNNNNHNNNCSHITPSYNDSSVRINRTSYENSHNLSNDLATLMRLTDNLHLETANLNARSNEDTDDPPDYMPMLPPTYEEAMALSERFYDETTISLLENVSMSSILTNHLNNNDHLQSNSNNNNNNANENYSNNKSETFKPRYPVFYDYETPTIPSEAIIYEEVSSSNQEGSSCGLANATNPTNSSTAGCRFAYL